MIITCIWTGPNDLRKKAIDLLEFLFELKIPLLQNESTARIIEFVSKEKSSITDLAVIARRPQVGGYRSNLIQAQKIKRLLRFARNDMIKKCRIRSGTNEFLVQKYQNQRNCLTIRQPTDDMTVFFWGGFLQQDLILLSQIKNDPKFSCTRAS